MDRIIEIDFFLIRCLKVLSGEVGAWMVFREYWRELIVFMIFILVILGIMGGYWFLDK